jgi:hypothetical protein
MNGWDNEADESLYFSTGNMSQWVGFCMSSADECFWIFDDFGEPDECGDVLSIVSAPCVFPSSFMC